MKNWNIPEKSWKLIHDLHMLSFNSMQEFSRKNLESSICNKLEKAEET